MSVTCSICYAWRPKNWNGWDWTDTSALCSIYNRDKGPDETCAHGAIVKPQVASARAAIAISHTNTEDDLANWYEEHKSEHDFITMNTSTETLLFNHQQEDIDRYSGQSEIALFHEPGCGKSCIALRIAGEKYIRGEIDALLVIAPNGVHKQWATEQAPLWLQADIPRQIMCFGGRGGMKEWRPFYDDPSLQICCVNIDTFSTPNKWRVVTEWANAHKTMIVLDEATTIKSVKSKRTEHVLYEFNDVVKHGKRVVSSKVKSAARAVLTGTPVTNGPCDLWAIMEFVRPNYFGRNWYAFQNYYAMHHTIDVRDDEGNGRKIEVLLNEDIWNQVKQMQEYREAQFVFGISADTFNTIHSQECYQGPYKHADELRELLKPVASFRMLKDCVDMPAQNFNRRLIKMDGEIARCYYEMEDELLTIYDDRMSNAKSVIAAIIRLQQISSGFLSTLVDEMTEDGDLFPNDITWIGNSNAKLEALYNDVAESAKPVIIVTHFTAEAARIYEDLKGKYRCCLMTGWKKEGTMEEFKDGKYEVCVANIRVISRGFNMQNSHTMLFYSNTFSLEDRLQVEGRIWRAGQTTKCEYIDYIYEDTVDMKIVGALRQKRSLLDYIRGVGITSFLREQDDVFKIEYNGVY